ncbi:ABC transporter ATP-binding protein [Zavarzinia compransoris]|uniref:Microcin ABC transporter ATP-binding protein n=1 Tax=Zavarzinia compransoris TaxID=1264899 RepID=A0A317E3V8_9PROT|nr:dipeptide ABC transporter ATP-binding protein [Zavarzinia compransoris]PWR21798.1 microcin ABC transporter ATP-binding protein [Zavarzinia compransoris]TDP45403.1 microcin C transport system ATP-binding protein [Zavarzinia compransoris]
MSAPLLAIRDLCVRFRNEKGTRDVVAGVSLDVNPGEIVALVGESGSGKSVTALSILQLLPPGLGSNPAGSIRLDGTEMVGAPEAVLRAARGPKAAMIFQEPMTALNPLHSIGRQIGEVLALRSPLDATARRRRIGDLLREVGLEALAGRLDAFPHQLSGGQRQRVMIAMALAAEPRLLIADEPTTALDVTVEAKILDLLHHLVESRGLGLLLITHNLNVVRRHADRVLVMHQGALVEGGPTEAIFTAPAHDYTRHLIAAEPKGRPAPVAPEAPDVLNAADIRVAFTLSRTVFGATRSELVAVDRAALTVRRGETLAIVGESGSGKSTLGFALLRLVPSTGRIVFLGQDLRRLSGRALRARRRAFQIVFQDPYGSLSPRMTIGDVVGEGLAAHGLEADAAARRARVQAVLAEVGLDPEMIDRFPHEFSGGQRQRVAIARALALDPDLVVLDEPTSALDRSIQAQVIDLLRAIQAKRGLAYLFISHDLKVVRAMSHRLIVMKAGRIVETGPVEAVIAAPREAYTKALIDAAMLNA